MACNTVLEWKSKAKMAQDPNFKPLMKAMKNIIPFTQAQNLKYDVSGAPWHPKDKEACRRQGYSKVMM